MAATNDGRPLEMASMVWRQYRACAITARGMKSSQNSARKKTLLLAFAGGLLSTLAGVVGGAPSAAGSANEPIAAVLGVLAAVAIGLAGFIGRELLSPTREDEWVRCRALAEALKRDVFKVLVRIGPYDGPTAGDVLRVRTETLLRNSGLTLDAAVMKRTDDKQLPDVNTIDDYIRERIDDQLETFYVPSAAKHQRDLLRYKTYTFALGGVAVVMSAVGAKLHEVALWVPVVTTAAAALTTFIQAQRLQGLVPLYQQTEFQLRLALASWRDQAAARGAMRPERLRELTAEFVNRCEGILSQENEAWRAEWESKDKKGSIESFVKQVEETRGKSE